MGGWLGLANFWGVEPGPGLMLAVLTMMMLLGFRFLRDPQAVGPRLLPTRSVIARMSSACRIHWTRPSRTSTTSVTGPR